MKVKVAKLPPLCLLGYFLQHFIIQHAKGFTMYGVNQ